MAVFISSATLASVRRVRRPALGAGRRGPAAIHGGYDTQASLKYVRSSAAEMQ